MDVMYVCGLLYLYLFVFFKHLVGIFIVFSTEVSCLFKLFYSELHTACTEEDALKSQKEERRRGGRKGEEKVDSTLILFCVNENKKNIRSLLIKEKYSNEKPRENL